jgi:PadR family transcriptional regulator, regulatory protein PadR
MNSARPDPYVGRALTSLERHMVESQVTVMPRKAQSQGDMLQGTLDMLILQTLLLGAAHGHSIAHAIERRSSDILQVEHGSLYPALYRLEDRGWIASFWGTSENNRKAKYYRLTPAGRKQLAVETTRWERLVSGITRILRPATE